MSATILHDRLMLSAIPPQLDCLLLALDAVRPQGYGVIVPDDLVVEMRRVLADIRRLSAHTVPKRLADPVAPISRVDLGVLIVTAQDHVERIGWHLRSQPMEKRHAFRWLEKDS